MHQSIKRQLILSIQLVDTVDLINPIVPLLFPFSVFLVDWGKYYFFVTSSVILLVRSHLLPISLMFDTQSYIVTHSRGETSIPERNGLLLRISWPTFYSWLSPNNITLLFFFRSYQLQQGGYENHFNSHSIWWSSKQWYSHLYLVVW